MSVPESGDTSIISSGGGSRRSKWQHPDSALTTSVGVTYPARYIGNIPIHISMRALNFDQRSRLTCEAIARVCRAAGVRLANRMLNVATVVPQINTALCDPPNLVSGGCDVTLSITTTHLTLISKRTSAILFQHELCSVSFSLANSSPEQVDKCAVDSRYAAYVVNDAKLGRICMVLDCGDRSTEVIKTIGQAFDVRFRMSRSSNTNNTNTAPKSSSSSSTADSVPMNSTPCPTTSSSSFEAIPPPPTAPASNSMPSNITTPNSDALFSEPTYYNDLPNKCAPPVNLALLRQITQSNCAPSPPRTPDPWRHRHHHSVEDPSTTTTTTDHTMIIHDSPIYQNDSVAVAAAAAAAITTPARPLARSVAFSNLPQVVSLDSELSSEPWFHGEISREQAESLVKRVGDFLVRVSRKQSPDKQFIITTKQVGGIRHIQLHRVDGKILGNDQDEFDSVSHLIHSYRENGVPLRTTNDQCSLLFNPIHRQR